MKQLLMDTISMLFSLINFILLIRIILSWLPIGRNAFTNILYSLTEPLLAPIRNLLNKSPISEGLMVDFSPIILVIVLSFIEKALIFTIATL